MVPQSVFNKIIEKQSNAMRNENQINCNDIVPKPTNYYFNPFVKHMKSDGVDFMTL